MLPDLSSVLLGTKRVSKSPGTKNLGSGLPSAVQCDDKNCERVFANDRMTRLGRRRTFIREPYPGSERFGDWVLDPGGIVVERSQQRSFAPTIWKRLAVPPRASALGTVGTACLYLGS
jgi:hypothetical protein